MLDMPQELMTPDEAAKWFRRSPSWLRKQHDLVRLGSPGGQPLFHVRACRAFVLAKMCNHAPERLRHMQLTALAEACGVPVDQLPVMSVEETAPAPAISA